MKQLGYLLFLIIFSCSLPTSAQTLPEYGINKARIAMPNQIIVAEFDPVSSHGKAKNLLWYYWYDANAVHSSQGSFSGKLLNGKYEEFFLSKNLQTQGHFRAGLKDGEWKQWDDTGKLLAVTYWKNGVQQVGEHTTFWKRLPLLKKKVHKTVPDTAKRVA